MQYRDYEEDPGLDPSVAYQHGFRTGVLVGILIGAFSAGSAILLVGVWMVQTWAGH